MEYCSLKQGALLLSRRAMHCRFATVENGRTRVVARANGYSHQYIHIPCLGAALVDQHM